MCFDFKTRQSYVHIWSLNREFWCSIGQIHHESLEDLIATVKTDTDLLGKTVAAVCSWSKTFLLKLGKTACQGPDMGPCATVGPRESQGKTKFKRESTNRIQLSQHYFEMMFALISSYFHISLASFFFLPGCMWNSKIPLMQQTHRRYRSDRVWD